MKSWNKTVDCLSKLLNFSRTSQKQPVAQRPENVFLNAKDIAFALVSDLAGIPFGDVRMDEIYSAKGIGGFSVIRCESRNGLTTVDIDGVFDYNRDKCKDPILKNGAFCPLVQIHCEAFQERYSLRAETKEEFMDLYGKSMMLIDSSGHIERLKLDERMYFNLIETKGTPMESNTSFRAYSYSWYEAAKVGLSAKSPDERWCDFVETVKKFCNLLDSGFKKFGLWEDETWKNVVAERCRNI